MNMSVNLGEWKPSTKDTSSDADSRGEGLRKASPSRQRRMVRRAAERAAASADAEKAGAASKGNAAVKAVAEKASAEKATAEKASAEKANAEKVTDDKAIAAAEKIAAAEADLMPSPSEEIATTSSKRGLPPVTMTLCPFCHLQGGLEYMEACHCKSGEDPCDCTCACDQEQMAHKAVLFPGSIYWTVQPPEERKRLLAKAARWK